MFECSSCNKFKQKCKWNQWRKCWTLEETKDITRLDDWIILVRSTVVYILLNVQCIFDWKTDRLQFIARKNGWFEVNPNWKLFWLICLTSTSFCLSNLYMYPMPQTALWAHTLCQTKLSARLNLHLWHKIFFFHCLHSSVVHHLLSFAPHNEDSCFTKTTT